MGIVQEDTRATSSGAMLARLEIRVKPEARSVATLRTMLPGLPILRQSSQPSEQRNAVPVPQQWRDDDYRDMCIIRVLFRLLEKSGLPS